MVKDKKLILGLFFIFISFFAVDILKGGVFPKAALAATDVCINLYGRNAKLINSYDINRNLSLESEEFNKAVSDWLDRKIFDGQILVILEFSKRDCKIPSLTVISPNGGETWVTGTTQQIKWTAPSQVRTVDIDLIATSTAATTQGVRFFAIARNVPNNGVFDWKVGRQFFGFDIGISPGSYIVSVKNVVNQVKDTSDAPFNIVASQIDLTVKSIQVVSTSTTSTAQFSVTWCNVGTEPLNELPNVIANANGRSKTLQASTTLPLAKDQCTNTVFSFSDFGMMSGTNYIVTATVDPGNKILESNERNNTLRSIIQLPLALLTVISPNGGETWVTGTTQQIKWTAPPQVRTVDIDLIATSTATTTQGVRFFAIARNVPNNGVFDWNVGRNFFGLGIPPGSYIVSVKDIQNRVRDTSDAPFSIVIGNRPPTISGIFGPKVLKVSEAGEWKITAFDPEQGPLTYSVVWGDEPKIISPVSAPVVFKQTESGQTATFTHSYSLPGKYAPTFTVTDTEGLSAKASTIVNVE
jgi:hypothetical protein